MTYTSRPTMLPPGSSGASLRQPSNHHAISQQQSSALAIRIASKKAELENLRHLRDLSAILATQMQTLESKIGTLNDGTEAVACVLANWDNVLRAISMASSKAVDLKDSAVSSEDVGDNQAETPLPATLVRIPAESQEKTSE
ncbi:DASH complex subunit DAD2 [Aspergillus ruber CBS 135680]|uniref:DASH complex subunit DAD2 n=1 Tax=Aspergillus ruber (strain CBS 135680) TaxID=1388766 RepID=A0A017S6E1_ASPRC|nr:uncharacterized protein EURHEDRAFT_462099 [Aspergillus ruber CBS 135680]EYE92573.1 hypothetical protein EURHEDRAFT_462099 [Aspergillus ruber CBS 135680]